MTRGAGRPASGKRAKELGAPRLYASLEEQEWRFGLLSVALLAAAITRQNAKVMISQETDVASSAEFYLRWLQHKLDTWETA